MRAYGRFQERLTVFSLASEPTLHTPAELHAYVDAFDVRHAVGLTGPASEIKARAQCYRVGSQTEKMPRITTEKLEIYLSEC